MFKLNVFFNKVLTISLYYKDTVEPHYIKDVQKQPFADRCSWEILRKTSILESLFRGATKFYFMYYSRVVSILFSASLYKSAFSAYSFRKARFSSFVFLCLWLLSFSFVLCFEVNIFLKDLVKFYNQGI